MYFMDSKKIYENLLCEKSKSKIRYTHTHKPTNMPPVRSWFWIILPHPLPLLSRGPRKESDEKVGLESACQCRRHGFVPRSGRIPHAAERLGPWATTTEPARLEPVLRNGRGRDSERPAHRDEEWPPLAATGESPCTETKTQSSQK